MKKLILLMLSVCLLCSITACGKTSIHKQKSGTYKKDVQQNYEKIEETYPEWFKDGKVEYPYTIQSDQIKNATSYKERTELLNVPLEIVNNTSTTELYRLAREYPILDLSLYDSMEKAIKNYCAVSSVYKELFQRENYPDVAFENYESDIKLMEKANNHDEYTSILTKLKLDTYMIGSQYGYERLSGNKTKEVKSLYNDAYTAIKNTARRLDDDYDELEKLSWK